MDVDKESKPSTEFVLTWDELGRKAVSKLIDTLFSERPYLWVIAALGLVFVYDLIYIYSLPESERLIAKSRLKDASAAIISIFNDNAVAWIGWILFIVTLVFFSVVCAIQWKRIQAQGKKIHEYRDKQDALRVTSRNVKTIDDYDNMMKRRLGEDE